jgi:predicted RNA binding protein YcfA (HicA-like mRNA interferase family)
MGLKDHSKHTRDVVSRLQAEGWIVARKAQATMCSTGHPMRLGRVTVDMGKREQTPNTLRSIYRQAGWDW